MNKRIIMQLSTAILTLLTPLAMAEPQLLKLDDFAYGANLTSAESEFRRFTLSPTMIKSMQRRDFGDVRVFDGNNELMSTLVRKKGGNEKIGQQTLTPYPYIVSGVTDGYILDRTAKHKQSLKSLHLRWKQGAAPGILSVRVEHSADKKTWNTLNDSETVINFKFNDTALKQNIIDINSYTQQYIKLTFLNKKQVAALASVKAYTTVNKLPDELWVPIGRLQPHKSISNGYRFSVSKAISPRLIKLSFGKLNTVLSGSLYTITSIDDKLQQKLVVNNFYAYVVTLNNKVVKSKPIDVSNWTSSEWLITTNAENNFSENDLPGITVAYPHYEVIFASDGDEPYTAVWGNSEAGAPMTGDIVERIKAKSLRWKDIAVARTGSPLNNARLTELMESRQTPWLMLIVGGLVIIIVTAVSIFAYKRNQ